MLSEALPSTQNPRRFRATSLLQFVSLTSLLLCYALLNACSVASSAPVPAAAKPSTSPATNPGTRSLALSGNLLPGEVGVSYNGTLSVSGGAAPYQFSISEAGGVLVTVTPATATVQSAGTAQFTALVSNTSNVAVTWKASPGTISSAGLYQAPTVSVTTPATLTATSVADPTKSATASVTITSTSAPLAI